MLVISVYGIIHNICCTFVEFTIGHHCSSSRSLTASNNGETTACPRVSVLLRWNATRRRPAKPQSALSSLILVLRLSRFDLGSHYGKSERIFFSCYRHNHSLCDVTQPQDPLACFNLMLQLVSLFEASLQSPNLGSMWKSTKKKLQTLFLIGGDPLRK